MSEFKFACPVCGQHITADSSASGGQLECPTCFQKIVIPQAPSSADSKFILSAAQVGKPRPPATGFANSDAPVRASAKGAPVAIALLLLICAAAAAAFIFRDKIFKTRKAADLPATNSVAKKTAEVVPMTINPIPTNFAWTLSLTNLSIPEVPAAGRIHGHGFLCERSTLQGGTLTLRQGKAWPPDLGVTIMLVAKQGEELSGKTVEIPAERPPPVPRAILRWKDEQQEPITHNVNAGYALRVIFGEAANGRMPGKLYIAFPDDAKSFVAGTFDAEIRKATPPRKKAPKQAARP